MIKFKEEDLNDIRKYLDLRNQQEQLRKDLEERLKDTILKYYGQEIVDIENHKVEVDKNGREYIVFGKFNDKAYKQPGGHFVYQVTEGEDDYWGYIFYPIKDYEYLQVSF